MSERENVILDGVEYYFDTTGEDGGNVCLDCVAHLGEKLCLQLPDCLRGVWKVKPQEATR
jgi:hypothetical protein